jgi:prephenate dehydratase
VPSIGYLGPRGTFTEEALQSRLSGIYDEMIPYPTVPSVLLAVQSGEIDSGMVPIENSVEGSVNATIDTLTFETELVIEREVVYPISQMLLAKPGVGIADVKAVLSHPQATAQCARFLAERLPGVEVRASNSTAEAAREVSGADEPLAAISTEHAAGIYGLEVIARDIEDYPSNATRFIVVGSERNPPSGADKTSMVCFIMENRPGSLLEILSQFAFRAINLTKIESRPTRKVLGEYCFFIDVEGHSEAEPLAGALAALRPALRRLKLLGSYPADTPPD